MPDTYQRLLERQAVQGDEEALEKLKVIDRRTTGIPMEVWNEIERRYYASPSGSTGSTLRILMATPLAMCKLNSRLTPRIQPWRIRYYTKADYTKAHAWEMTVFEEPSIARKLGRYSGWRKAHTESYWVYFALDLATKPCPTCSGDGSEFTGCVECHGYGVPYDA